MFPSTRVEFRERIQVTMSTLFTISMTGKSIIERVNRVWPSKPTIQARTNLALARQSKNQFSVCSFICDDENEDDNIWGRVGIITETDRNEQQSTRTMRWYIVWPCCRPCQSRTSNRPIKVNQIWSDTASQTIVYLHQILFNQKKIYILNNHIREYTMTMQAWN